MMNAFLLLGVLLLLLLQAVEVRRRMRDPEVVSARQFWRRMITAGMLEVVLLMWLVGEPLMGRQPPLTRLAYWSAIPLLTFAAILSAIREMAEVTRSYNRLRADLFRKGSAEGAKEETPRQSRDPAAG
jgi:hypothetical protein